MKLIEGEKTVEEDEALKQKVVSYKEYNQL